MLAEERFREILKIVKDNSSRTDCFVADFRIYDPQRPYHTPSARGVDQGAWRRYDCRVRNDDKRCGSFFEKYFE